MTTTDEQSKAAWCAVQWPKTALRVTFGVIWLVDAVLKWLPGFRRDYMDTIMGQADGQPGWLRGGSGSGSTCSTRTRRSTPTWSPSSRPSSPWR